MASTPATGRENESIDYASPGALKAHLSRDGASRGGMLRGIGIAYLILIAIGVIVFLLPGATIKGNAFSVERSVFTVVNAITLTGFQQSVPLDDYGPTGVACVLTLMIIGSLLAMIVGGIGVTRLLRLPYTDRQIIIATLYAYVVAVSLGAAIVAQPGRGLIASATQAASAFGNSGLYLGRLPGVAEWRTHAALMPLAFLGGLSIPVLLEIADLVFHRRPLSLHSRVVLTISAALYLVGLFFLSPWNRTSIAASLAAGSSLSIDSRSAGLPLMPIGALPRAGQWMLIVLMLIGGAPGSAAGGIKVTSLFHLVRGTQRSLRREGGLRITGVAAVMITGYFLLVLATTLSLLAALPELPADRVLFLATSAVGSVGLAHDHVAIEGPGNYVLALAMLLGRLFPLVVLWWAVRTTDDADVAVG
ncbi:MAG: trk/ktr system potassium uptake protein [Phycisphaerales bacterium]|jgi:trk system potassium uptake protein TrkH|nr:trk/ktr system potassium uptake protein [Phycisphaerales bacterium]